MAVLSEFVGLGALLGAFIAGIILQKSFVTEKNRKIESKDLRLFVFSFIIPFFFVNIGLHFDYHVFLHSLFLTGVIVVVAIIGKLLGTFLTKPFVKLSWKQLHLIGWGMNSRGVMELIMAHIALSAGLIPESLYSAIVFMAIFTTVLFPFIFRKILKHNPQIMN
jgi:Kef-type K+ transport system membrane component KefB